MEIADGMGGIVASTKMFAKAAAEGSFAVNETGGQALLAAITRMKTWINSQGRHLTRLEQPAPLGTSQGAQTMRPYLQQVANDHEGFITTLEQFRESLNEAEQGIKAAMASYQNTDTNASGGFAQV